MSGSEDEDESLVIIKHGDITETLPLSDANNAQKVKDKFGLDHEPSFVFGKMNKRVYFGCLKPGIPYNLEDTDKIPGQKVHTQNAVVISNAVYKDDPTAYLTESSPNHTISTEFISTQHKLRVESRDYRLSYNRALVLRYFLLNIKCNEDNL